MKDCPVTVGEILAKKYRVERILGFGGMGAVVAAWHLELEQLVAMKFLLPELSANEEAAERFRREARAAVKIKSEHVARVLDVGTMQGGVPYMVMEYMDGRDLAAELEHCGSLPVTEAVGYLIQACEAIAEAHSVGIIHRDLKPANLFLTRRTDGSRLVKVLDFGISKSLSGSVSSDMSLTRTAAIVGSPLYMSPEQLESAKDVDPRADIWSLGVILYELLSGSVPFLGETIPQLVRAVLAADRKPLNDVVPGVPPGLENIIARCLCQNRDERFANVAELTQALVEYGPERCVVSAERVSRLLAVPLSLPISLAAKPTTTLLSEPHAGTTDSSAAEREGSSSHEASPTAPKKRPSGGTLASWGKTDPNMVESQPESVVAKGRLLWVAAAAVLLAGSATALLTTQSGDGASATTSASPHVLGDEPHSDAEPVAAVPADPSPYERAAKPPGTSPTAAPRVAPVPSASAEAFPVLPKKVTSAHHPKEEPSRSTPRPKAASSRPSPVPTQDQHQAPSPDNPAQEWTDFGGRR